jgi:hypothetical protein
MFPLGSRQKVRGEPPTPVHILVEILMAELVERVCPVCGIVYGLPAAFYNARKDGSSKEGWYCPNGHSLSITKSEAAKLREQLDEERRQRQRAEQSVAMWQDFEKEARQQAEHERHRANGYKGHATKITKRAKAGVCPCCNRSFENLRRHMATKHPTFTPMELEDRPPEGATVQ